MRLFPDAEAFRRLVDGSDTRAGAALVRAALSPAGIAWSTIMSARNLAYDAGVLPVARAPVPVVCVGNLTLGGTGKTPLVAWITRRLAARGMRPAIVSRGYGAARGATSDEAAELALLLPGVLHVADRDRVAAARAAAAGGAGAVVLDDGFQHRRLARDLDIVAIDATDPFGQDRVFPRGLLREKASGLRRARAAILTRSRSVDAVRRREIRARYAALCGGRVPAAWAEAHHAPAGLRDAGGRREDSTWLAGRRVAAFAGIGNPSAFHATLTGLGAEVVGFRPFADHHRYSRADVDDLASWAGRLGALALVTTLKDMVKLPGGEERSPPILALEIALEMDSGAEEIDALLGALAGGTA